MFASGISPSVKNSLQRSQSIEIARNKISSKEMVSTSTDPLSKAGAESTVPAEHNESAARLLLQGLGLSIVLYFPMAILFSADHAAEFLLRNLPNFLLLSTVYVGSAFIFLSNFSSDSSNFFE